MCEQNCTGFIFCKLYSVVLQKLLLVDLKASIFVICLYLTGNESFNNILVMVFGNVNFCGPVIAFFLDNTVSGKSRTMLLHFPHIINPLKTTGIFHKATYNKLRGSLYIFRVHKP